MISTVIALAAIQGLAEGLPVSSTAHHAIAKFLLFPTGSDEQLDVAAQALGTVACAGSAAAIVLLLWTRLRGIANGSGERARHEVAVVVVGALASLVAGEVVGLVSHEWAKTTTAIGAGLVMTAGVMASLLLCPEGKDQSPTLRGALLAGLLQGVAVLPGASRVGAGLFVALWLGVQPRRALELSLAWTAPVLLVTVARDLGRAGLLLDGATALLAFAVATVTTIAGVLATRALVDRSRLALLSLWTLPLGFAVLAYARAVTSF